MSMSIVLALLIIAAVIIVVVAIVLYRAWYQHRINQQLHNETPRTRSFLPPWAFAIIVAFVAFMAVPGTASLLALKYADTEKPPDEYLKATYDFSSFNPDEMTGYRSLYSIDENPGYTKETAQRGDVLFTYFIRDDAFDLYHPAFIVYVEYTGSKDILRYGINGDYLTPEGALLGGWGYFGSEFDGYFCVFGTSTLQTRFDLTVYLYDTDRKSENPNDYAVARESISLLLPKQ